jgi:hypothetical protein
VLLHERAGAPGVPDGGLDLPAVPHDPRVAEEAPHVARAEAGHLLEVEAGEGAPGRLALAQDGP